MVDKNRRTRSTRSARDPDELKDVVEAAEDVVEREKGDQDAASQGMFRDPRQVEFLDEPGAVGTMAVAQAALRIAQTLRESPAMGTTERAVTLRRTEMGPRPMDKLWWAINLHTDALSFDNYARFLDRALCRRDGSVRDDLGSVVSEFKEGLRGGRRPLHLPGAEMYEYLKQATEEFLLLHTGFVPTVQGVGLSLRPAGMDDPDELVDDSGVDRLGSGEPSLTFEEAGRRLEHFLGSSRNNYLTTVMQNVYGLSNVTPASGICVAMANRLDVPVLLELIWSYWMEEGMLNQTVATITRRFQNVRRPGRGLDPLAEFELDPLRPLNGFIWGYLQDEPSRLSVVRRAYEYNHHYGFTLYGNAVPALRPADPRVRFLEGFHNLLRQAAAFYREDNDTTVIADAFPVLNSLKEVHLLLSEGAHNQFRDLPWQARAEMMLQQYLLARPEMREFLRGRYMVAYPEPWMGAVDSMKRLQGWTDTSVRYFRDLANFGERILLSIRYGNWNDVHDQDDARAWLRYWRPEIQGYIHAYHTATGVNLSDDVVEVRNRTDARYVQPSWHLRNRLIASRRALRP